jgi:MFS family permease
MTPAAHRIPRGVWVLGVVSLFMDTSSEIIHSVLPVFLTAVLGLPVVSVGVIEGVAEATANITKAFSGAVSDRFGKRKLLAVLGYGLAAATKPVFPLAQGMSEVLLARFVDRVGKGIRGAPRDALIADITHEAARGASFGLRQALDSVGAVAGPALAFLLLWATADNYRAVMWFAVIPAVLCVATLVWGIEEHAPKVPVERESRIFAARGWLELGRAYWLFVAVASLLMLPRFSEAFLLLRAKDVGLRGDLVPLVLAAMNVVYALVSFPAGKLSDRIGRKRMVAGGFSLLVLAHLVLAYAPSPSLVFLGAGIWGLHMGVTQGALSAIVADIAPARLRGTAFGLFYMATGIAALLGSLAAGELWDLVGAASMFVMAAAVTAAALLAYLALPAKH